MAIPEYVNGLPNICGQERLLDAVLRDARPACSRRARSTSAASASACAIALHMHQPLLPPAAATCAPRASSAISSG